MEVGKEWGDPCLGRSSVWGGGVTLGGTSARREQDLPGKGGWDGSTGVWGSALPGDGEGDTGSRTYQQRRGGPVQQLCSSVLLPAGRRFIQPPPGGPGSPWKRCFVSAFKPVLPITHSGCTGAASAQRDKKNNKTKKKKKEAFNRIGFPVAKSKGVLCS